MTRRIFKEPDQPKQPNNGGGMAKLSLEERKAIGQKSAKEAKARRSGWPDNFQGQNWDRENLEACSWEWARLMAKSERAHWKRK